jgi:hypothetical protein
MTHRISQIVTMVLAIAATVAIGGVVYQVMRGSTVPAPPAGQPGGTKLPEVLLARPMAQSQPDVVSNPLSLLAAGAADIQTVDADPGGLKPPPSARRVRTVRQATPAGLQELGVYLFKGTGDVIESFYAQGLAAAGWKSMGRARSGVLCFGRAGWICTLQVGQPSGGEVEFHVVVRQDLPSP